MQHAVIPDLPISHKDSLRVINIDLMENDPTIKKAMQLESLYPGHLILIQAGQFLHGFNRTAYALHAIKAYKLKLCGLSSDPYIRVGFPIGNFKRRLWSVIADFGIPYIVALGNQQRGYTVYIGESASTNAHVLNSVSPAVVNQVIDDLRKFSALNTAGAKKLLSEPNSLQFYLKSQAIALDILITADLVSLPRDVRAIWGENVRECMHRIMLSVFEYGNEPNKISLLLTLSANIDMLKHYITQAQKLKDVRFSFEHRASLVVELGRLVGGLIRSNKTTP